MPYYHFLVSLFQSLFRHEILPIQLRFSIYQSHSSQTFCLFFFVQKYCFDADLLSAFGFFLRDLWWAELNHFCRFSRPKFDAVCLHYRRTFFEKDIAHRMSKRLRKKWENTKSWAGFIQFWRHQLNLVKSWPIYQCFMSFFQ